jgi:hypothetical protein
MKSPRSGSTRQFPVLVDRRRQALAGFHRARKDSKTIKIKNNPTFQRLRTVVSIHGTAQGFVSRPQDCFSGRAEILVAFDLTDRTFFLMPIPAAVEKWRDTGTPD